MSLLSGVLSVLGGLLTQLPLIFVWIVAVVMAATRWKQHPRKSLFIVIAVAILFLQMVVGAFLNVSMPLWVTQRGMAMARMSMVFTILRVGGGLIAAVAWGLLVAAIFMEERANA